MKKLFILIIFLLSIILISSTYAIPEHYVNISNSFSTASQNSCSGTFFEWLGTTNITLEKVIVQSTTTPLRVFIYDSKQGIGNGGDCTALATAKWTANATNGIAWFPNITLNAKQNYTITTDNQNNNYQVNYVISIAPTTGTGNTNLLKFNGGVGALNGAGYFGSTTYSLRGLEFSNYSDTPQGILLNITFPTTNITLNYSTETCNFDLVYNTTYFEWNTNISDYDMSLLWLCNSTTYNYCLSIYYGIENNTLINDEVFYNNTDFKYYIVELRNISDDVIYQINTTNWINTTRFNCTNLPDCVENWTQINTTCNNYNYTFYYYDYNNCGTFNDTPLDNNTLFNCGVNNLNYTYIRLDTKSVLFTLTEIDIIFIVMISITIIIPFFMNDKRYLASLLPSGIFLFIYTNYLTNKFLKIFIDDITYIFIIRDILLIISGVFVIIGIIYSIEILLSSIYGTKDKKGIRRKKNRS